jgi:hypothetical protein
MKPVVIERWLIRMIAVHSLAVGVFLLFLTEWSVAFGGWGAAVPLFFPRQAGVFHIVVGVGYLYEYRRFRTVGLLLIAKSAAVLFLLAGTFVTDSTAWAVPLSALGDGAMGLAVLLVHNRVRRDE